MQTLYAGDDDARASALDSITLIRAAVTGDAETFNAFAATFTDAEELAKLLCSTLADAVTFLRLYCEATGKDPATFLDFSASEMRDAA